MMNIDRASAEVYPTQIIIHSHVDVYLFAKLRLPMDYADVFGDVFSVFQLNF